MKRAGLEESSVGNIDIDRKTGAVRAIDHAQRLVGAFEGLHAISKFKSLLALLEKVPLDSGKTLGRPIAEKVVQEVDGGEHIVVEIAFAVEVGTKNVELHGACSTHSEAVNIRPTRPGGLSLLPVEINLDANLAVEVLQAPGHPVAIKDDVVAESLLYSLRLPHGLDQAALFVTFTDHDLELVDWLVREGDDREGVESNLDRLTKSARSWTQRHAPDLVVTARGVPAHHAQVDVLVYSTHRPRGLRAASSS